MTGKDLRELLFPKTEKRGKKWGEQTKIAQFLGEKLKRDMRPQHVLGYFRAKHVNEEFLTAYAEFKGFDVKKFVEWANGPKTDKIYTENVYKSEEKAPSMLSEPNPEAYSEGGEELLKSELQKVFRENVALHQTIADRGNFIIKLLDK